MMKFSWKDPKLWPPLSSLSTPLRPLDHAAANGQLNAPAVQPEIQGGKMEH